MVRIRLLGLVAHAEINDVHGTMFMNQVISTYKGKMFRCIEIIDKRSQFFSLLCGALISLFPSKRSTQPSCVLSIIYIHDVDLNASLGNEHLDSTRAPAGWDTLSSYVTRSTEQLLHTSSNIQIASGASAVL
jgi:hypothetical protein